MHPKKQTMNEAVKHLGPARRLRVMALPKRELILRDLRVVKRNYILGHLSMGST